MNEVARKENLAVIKTDVVDVVSGKIRGLIEHGQLHLPAQFSAENALKSAWLILQSTVDKDKRPVLHVCTKDSIANALLDTVVQALNPGKQQCYYIAYGSTLVCQRSYFGDIALVRRIIPGAKIFYEVIWKGDEFEYEIVRGQKRIVKHVQKIENVGDLSKIAGAYCVIEIPEQPDRTTVMTIEQIKKSWEKSKTYNGKGGTPHTDTPDQMALRTVIRRACKPIINGSSDEYLRLSISRSDVDSTEAEIDAEADAQGDEEITIDAQPPALTEAQGVDEAQAEEQQKDGAAKRRVKVPF